MNKVSARSKRSKQPARKAPKPGTTPADRRLLAQAAEETAEGDGPPTIWEMADQMEGNDHMFVAAIAAVNELLLRDIARAAEVRP